LFKKDIFVGSLGDSGVRHKIQLLVVGIAACLSQQLPIQPSNLMSAECRLLQALRLVSAFQFPLVGIFLPIYHEDSQYWL
jgi:hypothetical protein